MPELFVITGWRGVGKTTLCLKVVEAMRNPGSFPGVNGIKMGWQVSGILSLAVIENGEKVAIDSLDLRSGEQRRLATRTPLPHHGTVMLDWAFNPETVEWGNQVLTGSVPTDLLVVDELGPLELIHGGGWQAGIRVLNGGSYRAAMVVIRPEFVDIFSSANGQTPPLANWSKAKIIRLDSQQHVEGIASQITQHLIRL